MTVLRNEVTEVNAFDVAAERLAGAEGLEPVLAASWEALYLIEDVAYQYGERQSALFAMWASAMPSASEARNALVQAPSSPGRCDLIDPGDLSAVSEEDAADALLALATDLCRKLRFVAGSAEPGDATACTRALEAAEELRGLFTPVG